MSIDVMFVVPAYQRFDVSRVAFASLAWTVAELDQLGFTAGVVVVADDRNLELAAGHGFDTLDRPNQLGEKLNDGFAYAAGQDAEFVVYVGSDDLLDPAHVAAQIRRHRALGDDGDFTVIASRTSSVVAPDGRSMLNIRIGYACGDGVQLRPTRLLARLGHRPVPRGRNRAMDGAMWTLLQDYGPLVFDYIDAAPGQIADLKSTDVQVTPFHKFIEAAAVHGDRIVIESTSSDPWADLARIYPAEIIDQAQSLYAAVAA